jgi:hypothetical protein
MSSYFLHQKKPSENSVKSLSFYKTEGGIDMPVTFVHAVIGTFSSR